MRKALIVGVDHYEHVSPLFGCVNDAHSVKAALERHGDGSINFTTPKLLTATGPTDDLSRPELKEAIRELFSGSDEIALFYFAGHGHIETTGGYILTSDSRTGDDGVSLSEVLCLANASTVRNKIIILDSCHSGIAGSNPTSSNYSEPLSDGLTILTASTAEQYATEQNGGGVFTNLLVDALNGSASNLVGDITPGSVYAHIDQSLGPWEQRPVFKTNVKSFVSLRTVQSPISMQDLQRIAVLFPYAGYEYKLDPSFEPERSEHDRAEGMPEPNPSNTEVFSVLQKFNRVNLLVPIDAPHMWHAAVQSKSCKLTALGEHYRNLAQKGLI